MCIRVHTWPFLFLVSAGPPRGSPHLTCRIETPCATSVHWEHGNSCRQDRNCHRGHARNRARHRAKNCCAKVHRSPSAGGARSPWTVPSSRCSLWGRSSDWLRMSPNWSRWMVFPRLSNEQFGGLDILVNNAGEGVFRKVGEMTLEEWRRNIDLNLNGAFYCAHEALARFRAARRRLHRQHLQPRGQEPVQRRRGLQCLEIRPQRLQRSDDARPSL